MKSSRRIVALLLNFLFWIFGSFSLGRSFSPTSCSTKTTSYMCTDNCNPSDNANDFRLGYVTDVEGNLDYFLKFAERCRVLRVSSLQHNGNDDITSLKLDLVGHNSYFVYGGDAVDKGPGDIRLVRALVDLKQRYPDNVYLLVGNRDLNKLRFSAELSEEDLQRNLEDLPPPHWDPKAPSLKEFLTKKAHEVSNGKIISVEKINTRANRLKYMLQHTLGCPQTFEFRRQELAIMQQNTKEAITVTDDEVVDSFIKEVQPGGSLFEYLCCANVAVVIGNTLFCHGAVDQRTMQFVPSPKTRFENPTSKPPPAAVVQSVEEWTDALNDYLQQGLDDYQQRPLWNADRTSRGGEALLALQNRSAMWGRSIISNCYSDGGCITTERAQQVLSQTIIGKEETITNPLNFEKICSDPKDPVVSQWLLSNGIQRVVVGHKPSGDCPAILSSCYTGVEIVSADTSFSDVSSGSNRGVAVSVVELVGSNPHDNYLCISGNLKNDQEFKSNFHRLHSKTQIDDNVGDVWVGRQLPSNDWWVKTKTIKGSYWLTRGEGRKVEYRHIDQTELQQYIS